MNGLMWCWRKLLESSGMFHFQNAQFRIPLVQNVIRFNPLQMSGRELTVIQKIHASAWNMQVWDQRLRKIHSRWSNWNNIRCGWGKFKTCHSFSRKLFSRERLTHKRVHDSREITSYAGKFTRKCNLSTLQLQYARQPPGSSKELQGEKNQILRCHLAIN